MNKRWIFPTYENVLVGFDGMVYVFDGMNEKNIFLYRDKIAEESKRVAIILISPQRDKDLRIIANGVEHMYKARLFCNIEGVLYEKVGTEYVTLECEFYDDDSH